jgi:hypothetical protein
VPERGASAELRASAFVAISGAIEQWFSEYVAWLSDEVLATATSHRDLLLSLHAIASTDDFRSLQATRDPEKVFERRIALLERTGEATKCALPIRGDELGLSGVTIRPSQVNSIWRLFGLPGSAFGNVRQQLALRVFADNRNDFAHGKVPIEDFLQNPECEVPRMLTRIGDLEAWCFHCWSSADAYVVDQMYRR